MRVRSVAAVAFLSIVTLGMDLDCRNKDEDGAADRLVEGQRLPRALANRLRDAGWPGRAGDELGLWVSARRQRLFGIQSEKVVFTCVCSTAEKGLGNEANSFQTPPGWHEIDERIGVGAPLGTVFVERKPTGRIWKPGEAKEKDYVLTRILWLRGLEPGKNAGPGVDSHDRYIYIHGTPAEHRLGTPVLITEW